ncbi:MAG: hypothetical protein WHT07_01820 [Desulfobaccales bacterium]
MPNGTPAQQIADLISTPLEELLVALGSGIGRAQAELDRHSIEIQKLILEDPVLSQYGLEATWYQIPRTELELKIAVALEHPSPKAEPPRVGGVIRKPLPRLYAQPVNARYTNQFSYDIQAASTVKLAVVAVPPPGVAAATPALTEEAALAAALPYLFKDAQGKPEPRVTVNFNGGARTWYIVQTAEKDGAVTLRALVKVDDLTAQVLERRGGPGG